MGVLREGEIEVAGYVLGASPDSAVFIESFDPGIADVRTQDVDNPVGDDTAFGRDFFTGPTWTLDLVVNRRNAAEALQTLGELSAVWRADAVRSTPGAEVVLRYALGGRTRRVYGRPRKFAYTPNGLTSGVILATAEFKARNLVYFDDDERVLPLQIIPPSSGGFTAPFTAPIIPAPTGEVQGPIADVGGDIPAPFTVTFNGPITNPRVAGNGWEIELRDSLAWDQSVTVDTRLKTVKRNDGANLSGKLTHRSNLGTARLTPGPDYVTFSGYDATGTATARVAWRPAYAGL